MLRFALWLSLVLAACHREPVESRPSLSPKLEMEAPRSPIDSVVLVTIDTLRADALGVYGGPARTPTIDKLGRDGWLFERCVSASMLTNPAHASLMTSLYLRDHGVYDNESGVREEARTLAVSLKRHGLRTAAVIGFLHLNPEVSNLGLGFDKVVRATATERTATEAAESALQALDEVAPGGPFFLWVHMTDPHAPYDPDESLPLPALASKTPMAEAARAAPRFQRQNPWFAKAFQKYRFTEELSQRYFGEVEAADAGVAHLLEGLAQRNRLGRTAVIVTADHGENLGEHHLFFHHGGLYRETVMVPLIVSVPGMPAARIGGLVQSVDVAPTALDLVGAPFWEPMRGMSLVPVALGRKQPRAVAFAEHQLGQEAAVYTLTGSLILQRKSSKQFPSYPIVANHEELYDLVVDPNQTQPLAADHPLAAELRRQLWRYIGTGPEILGRKAEHLDRHALRTLGYIE
jgi:choline-sulfatase